MPLRPGCSHGGMLQVGGLLVIGSGALRHEGRARAKEPAENPVLNALDPILYRAMHTPRHPCGRPSTLRCLDRCVHAWVCVCARARARVRARWLAWPGGHPTIQDIACMYARTHMSIHRSKHSCMHACIHACMHAFTHASVMPANRPAVDQGMRVCMRRVCMRAMHHAGMPASYLWDTAGFLGTARPVTHQAQCHTCIHRSNACCVVATGMFVSAQGA